MGCKQKFKEVILKFDTFSTSQFLRYNCEPQYRTYTGAVCSIITFVTFFALFTNMIIATFQKQVILWSLNTVEQEVDTFSVSTKIDGQNKFMFAISIAGLDLSSNIKYFDIQLTLKTKINSISMNNTQIALEKCSPSHWSVNQQILQAYYRMNFSSMLCPSIGAQIPLQGKFTSETFKYAQIQIFKCTNNTSNASNICVDDSIIQNKTFLANIYFLNSLINPQLPEYLTYYLEDRNYIEFTTSYTSLLNLFISKFKIMTDESILPFQSNRQEIGPIVNSLAQVIPKQGESNKSLANIVMRRSSTTVLVNRSFKKIDETLSYIGGLFGFVLVFLMLMKEYTEYSFQIDASSHLYHKDDENSIDSSKFNFIVFIGYLFYLFLGFFGFSPNWKLMKTFDESREQLQQQFDVKFLFERINFIQKSLHLLLDEQEANLIHLTKKPTLKEAGQLRQKYSFKEVIKQNALQITENGLNEPSDAFHEQGKNNRVSNIKNAPQQRQADLQKGLKMLRKKTLTGHQLSKKIIQNLDPYIVQIIHETNAQGDYKSSSSSMEHFAKSDREKPNHTHPITQSFQHQPDLGEAQNQKNDEITNPMQMQRGTKDGEDNFEFVNGPFEQ